MQADADYRAFAEGLRNVYVRSRDGKPIPVTALAQVSMTTGPDLVERYNVFPAARVLGAPAPGYSSGQALDAMEELASDHLPDGYTMAWIPQAFLQRQSDGSSAGLSISGMFVLFLTL